MYTEDSQGYRGFTISIVHDDSPESPRDWDNLGTMITWERKYGTPDTNEFSQHDHNYEYADYNSRTGDWTPIAEDGSFQGYLMERRRERKSHDAGIIALSLSRNDYDGSISASAYDETEHHNGVMYVTYEDVREGHGNIRITRRLRDQVLRLLQHEVAAYSQWATGDVWGFVVGDGGDDHIDSCWGYYGTEDAMAAGEDAVDGLIAGGRQPVPMAEWDAAD